MPVISHGMTAGITRALCQPPTEYMQFFHGRNKTDAQPGSPRYIAPARGWVTAMSLEAPSGAKWEVVGKTPAGVLDCEAARQGEGQQARVNAHAECAGTMEWTGGRVVGKTPAGVLDCEAARPREGQQTRVNAHAECAGTMEWTGGRVVEGARLESVYTGDRIAGSNPALSAILRRKGSGATAPPRNKNIMLG